MCTGITLTTKDGGTVRGRTMEFNVPLKSDLILMPRGMTMAGTSPDPKTPGLSWKVSYATTGLNGLGLPIIVDGLNEKGLSGGVFYFPGYAQFQDVTPADYANTIAPWEVLSWILNTCASVEEVKTALPKIQVANVAYAGWGIVPPFHYYVADPSGGRIAIEYIGGALTIHDAPLGVFTNSPTFDWHMTNVKNYVSISPNPSKPVTVNDLKIAAPSTGGNLLGIPGDFLSPSRFVRAAVFSALTPQQATTEDAIWTGFHILDNFDIPLGAVPEPEGSNPPNEITEWTVMADMKALKFYAWTWDNREIRMIDLGKHAASGTSVTTFKLDQPQRATEIGG